jgi:hypothetical protein
MIGRTEGWLDGWTNGGTDRWANVWTDGSQATGGATGAATDAAAAIAGNARRRPTRSRTLICLAVATACLVGCGDEPAPMADTGSGPPSSADPWAVASDAVVHLPLDAFPALPAWARRRLEAHGCSVPQGFHSERPHNVMTGELAAPGQRDWATLCSRGDTTEIVVA